MFQIENEKIYIEHCQNCSSHSWCTKHDESKYKSYFENCKAKILVTCPEVQVLENQIPLVFSSKFMDSDSKISEKKPNFPRIGAFEIYFQEKIVFSKLESGLWPQSTIVANKIRELLDQSKLPAKSRELKPTNILKKRKKLKNNQRTIGSLEPNSFRKSSKREKSTTPYKTIKDPSLDDLKFGKNRDFSMRQKKNEYSEDFEEDFDYKNREITKIYELSLPYNGLSNKVRFNSE